MKKKKNLIFTFMILVFVLVGCFVFKNVFLNRLSGQVNNESENINQKKEVKKIKIIDLESNTRPYAVMINNISTVWGYQCGLDDAYIVYEIIVEGGYTRLMAVFKDKDLNRIGSVRSSRHYFLYFVLENDAIYVHFGWSPQAEADISKLVVNNINFMSYGGYERDYSIGLATEHTAFTSTDKINNGINYYGYRTTSSSYRLLDYSTDDIDLSTLEDSIVADSISIDYSSSRSTSFEYDSDNKVYKRYQNGKVHKDYISGKQYTAKNIITYQVNSYTISGDDKGRQTLDNIGSGEGWYITNGYAVPITWEKLSRSSKTIYKYLDGTKIKVNDGNTYIQIQPINRELTIE